MWEFVFLTIVKTLDLIETHIAKKQGNKIRFQEYGISIFNTISSKSALKKAIKKKQIHIDGKVATTAIYILGGEKIELYINDENTSSKKLKLDLEVLFEDDYLAIIYKPAGLLVSGNKFVTITNALPQNLQISKQKDAVKPQPVHRLDYPTSGLLLIGKTSSSIQKLNKLFVEKQITKIYYAITIGKMEKSGYIDKNIDTKKAITEFKVLESIKSERFNYLNLVELKPKTGRKHQLRKHLRNINNPILGDKLYFLEDKILNGKGLFLHAARLEFKHPIFKNKISVFKKYPKKFKKIFPNYKKC